MQRVKSILFLFLTCLAFNLAGCGPDQGDLNIQDGEPRPLVQVWSPGEGITHTFTGLGTVPAAWFAAEGVLVPEGARVLWNGREISLHEPLEETTHYLLQIQPAYHIEVLEEGEVTSFTSAAPTLGAALWEQGYRLRTADSLTQAYNALLTEDTAVVLSRAVPLHIQVDGHELETLSAAATVGAALAESGIALQALDYSIPTEGLPLPEDWIVQVVRVKEEIVLAQQTIPYTTERQPDPEEAIGQSWVIQGGQNGLQMTRQRIRYENGQEVSRVLEEEWIARQPQTELIGYGTMVVYGTTPEGGLQYWAAVDMYATSYYPCGFSDGICHYQTRSGMTLTKGVVAVTSEWYAALQGARVYIPGYGIGVIGDSGGGIPGKNWIDLGYDNANWVPWSQNVTVYFLDPAPEVIPWFLQN